MFNPKGISHMGLKFARPGPGKNGNATLLLQHRMLAYLTATSFIRNLVSKKRRRMVVGGYDLDMSYITDRLLAMSFPAERMRAMYRNPLWQVKSVLEMRHQGHYKIYNLCIEEDYDPLHFHGRVEKFPFDDNHVPSLQMMKLFCESVHSWLSNDPKNIAVIHCMAGKGRTGLMVCAYLVYSGMLAEEALQLYAQKRTTNNEGVSIPSQRRYVGYWENILSFPRGVRNGLPDVNLPPPCGRELRRIRLYDTIATTSVFFVVSELQEIPSQMYCPPVEVAKSCCREINKGYEVNSSPRYFLSFIEGEEEGNTSESEEPRVVVQMDTESPVLYQKTCLDYHFSKPVQVSGDVRVIFYQKMIGGRLFYACFNTAFIKNSLLQFTIRDLDKVGSTGRSICGPAFCMELLFGPANPKHSVSCSSDYDN
ncbi:PREDICTED: phosphatidylinositol 3,4,5-trisphosphate 3-phosphatase and protein-tyrosine-phosphatase PTEN1 isoform X1 [Theobroma cacao]|uniref:Phosphatidylinositol 3,4,5-trisphosphate 3-phosphatase and protein-tyrosine-phosphatase PTEN1 isoform X1 n=2 Tax=Theobroma cacao TaxID=3641 RepID=A0AB32V6J1_THECC|nr:PREDICTED: phosphatidylinositol 3,4,5-trisphosphate 3-phosphatase and protein-tyrosine-phosphatase PTEN1 isoform X1 [Theobroma cacao]